MMHGMSHLSHEVTNIHRGAAEVDIKLPSGINVIWHASEWHKWFIPWNPREFLHPFVQQLWSAVLSFLYTVKARIVAPAPIYEIFKIRWFWNLKIQPYISAGAYKLLAPERNLKGRHCIASYGALISGFLWDVHHFELCNSFICIRRFVFLISRTALIWVSLGRKLFWKLIFWLGYRRPGAYTRL